MQRKSKQVNYASQFQKTEVSKTQGVLINVNDMINREADPMNFLMDLQQKLKKEDSKTTPIKNLQQQDQKYSLIQKRRNTSTSQEISNRSAIKKTIKQPSIQQVQIKMPASNTNNNNNNNNNNSNININSNQNSNTKQINNEFSIVQSIQSYNESKLQQKSNRKDSTILLEHQYNDLLQKIQIKDQIINDQQLKLNQIHLYQKNIYSNVSEYQELKELYSVIDDYWIGDDDISYRDKLKSLLQQRIIEQKSDQDDQIMILMIDKKEMQVKVEELVENNQLLSSEQQLLKKHLNKYVEENNLLKLQVDTNLKQIQELSEMYDNIVNKYEIEIKDLETKLMESQKLKQQEEMENEDDVSHSMIEFQMSFQNSLHQSTSHRESDAQQFKDIFLTFQQKSTQETQSDDNQALLVQNAHLQYVISQMQNNNINNNQIVLKTICYEMFIFYLKQKQNQLKQMNENLEIKVKNQQIELKQLQERINDQNLSDSQVDKLGVIK